MKIKTNQQINSLILKKCNKVSAILVYKILAMLTYLSEFYTDEEGYFELAPGLLLTINRDYKKWLVIFKEAGIIDYTERNRFHIKMLHEFKKGARGAETIELDIEPVKIIETWLNS